MGAEIPLIPLLVSLYGILHVFAYMTLVGETCEEMGDTKWLIWGCRDE